MIPSYPGETIKVEPDEYGICWDHLWLTSWGAGVVAWGPEDRAIKYGRHTAETMARQLAKTYPGARAGWLP